MKKALAAFAILVGCFIVLAISTSKAPRSQQADASAPADPYEQAHYACEQWTRTHSKLGVAEVVEEYTVDRAKTRQGRYKVGLDYRAQGTGLLMQSTCEYAQAGTGLALVQARSQPAR